ncbi:MAG: HupE/UreJ family protein [Rhodocyclaceae bacterium]|nr:HupE/UreJ family protein [Rhodocyclaceae bacterium]
MILRTLFILALAANSSVAWGHSEGGQASGFIAGLLHPIGGMDHVLAMVAVGLWGAQLGNPALWMLPVAFPLVMAFGGFLGLIGVPLPGIEIGIALSGVLLGLAVATKLQPPLWVALLLVAVFAIFHGHAHGTELPEGASGLTYSLGFVIATGMLHASGISIGLVQRWQQGKLALRWIGGLISLGGAYFLFGALS